jgi:hypothetical protein
LDSDQLGDDFLDGHAQGEHGDRLGHRTTIVTQKVYRHQLRPVMSKGATTMNTIFSKREEHQAG